MPLFRRRDAEPEVVEVETPTPVVEDTLSSSAKQVMARFNRLPIDYRPAYDMRAIVEALDIKYGDLANSHVYFPSMSSYGDYPVPLTRCYCCHPRRKCDVAFLECQAPEYLELYSAIMEIQTALDERAHAARLAGVEHELASVSDVIDAFRADSRIVREVTGQIFNPSAP